MTREMKLEKTIEREREGWFTKFLGLRSEVGKNNRKRKRRMVHKIPRIENRGTYLSQICIVDN